MPCTTFSSETASKMYASAGTSGRAGDLASEGVDAGTSASLTSPSHSSLRNFASGCVAGGIATAVTHPADVVKTRMQLDTGDGTRGRRTLLQTMRAIAAADGVRGFWRGAAPRLVKRTLATTLTWVCFEGLLERVKDT